MSHAIRERERAELRALRTRMLSEAWLRKCFVITTEELRLLLACPSISTMHSAAGVLRYYLGLPVYVDRECIPRCTGCGAPREYRKCETCGRED